MTKKIHRKFLPGKMELFGKFENVAKKNRNFSEICLEKLRIFLPGSTTPHISNQIDAAAP